MKIPMFAVAAALIFVSAPVFAFHCPADIAKIDKALAAGPDLSANQIAEVKALRDEGQSLHEAGAHGRAVATLAKALDILSAEKKPSGDRY